MAKLKLIDTVLVGIFLLMIAIGMLQFLARMSGHSLSWSEELARYLMVWAIFLGFAVATRDRENITLDLLNDGILSPAADRVLRWVAAGVSLVSIAVFAYLAGVYTNEGIHRGLQSPAIGIPMWVPASAMTVGGLLTMFYIGRSMIKREIYNTAKVEALL